MPYPKTVLVNPESEIDSLVDSLTFPYPMILKPGNSISYLDVHFEGQKKAFTIESNEEMKLMLHRCYEAGYPDEMIIQDFIPGGDENMRVLNAYVDKNHKVRMMCLGHPLLEDQFTFLIYSFLLLDEITFFLLANFTFLCHHLPLLDF